ASRGEHQQHLPPDPADRAVRRPAVTAHGGALRRNASRQVSAAGHLHVLGRPGPPAAGDAESDEHPGRYPPDVVGDRPCATRGLVPPPARPAGTTGKGAEHMATSPTPPTPHWDAPAPGHD